MAAVARRKLMLFLKPLDDYYAFAGSSNSVVNQQILKHLSSRSRVHQDAIRHCQDILRRKPVEWQAVSRNDVSRPIRDVDMVLTIGGDGTLLRASHFVDGSVPILGVNSDPSVAEEIQQFSNEFDASRSTGFLCAATLDNFEQVIDSILEGSSIPSELSRISIFLNAKLLSTYALNDVLLAHPCPAAVSRFSLRYSYKKTDLILIMLEFIFVGVNVVETLLMVRRHGEDGQSSSPPLVNCRSSGLRVSTAAGSTAAMLSAGGHRIPILSRDLQYMVREPISPEKASSLMHGFVSCHESLEVGWSCKEGVIYVDGCHVRFPIKLGDRVEIASSRAPVLKVYLASRLFESREM